MTINKFISTFVLASLAVTTFSAQATDTCTVGDWGG